MDTKAILTVFITVFLAELGDKTQLATMLFAANQPAAKLMVFIAAAFALVLACAIGVLVGGWLNQHINPALLQKIAGIGFVMIGFWTFFKA